VTTSETPEALARNPLVFKCQTKPAEVYVRWQDNSTATDQLMQLTPDLVTGARHLSPVAAPSIKTLQESSFHTIRREREAKELTAILT
jgi:hypothetical protein